ncbi:AAA family ATPase [Thermoleophilia bacterium SCSIO 60948]|nr:AAA family ATPase [Thermoleophilia bacterium SCSIO 60948]
MTGAESERRLPLVVDLKISGFAAMKGEFFARATDSGLGHIREEDWKSKGEQLGELGSVPVLSFRDGENTDSALISVGDNLALVTRHNQSHIEAYVAGPTPAACDLEVERLRALLPEPVVEPAGETVEVSVWSEIEQIGQRRRDREIPVRQWGEVSANYVGSARTELDRLMALTPENVGPGRVIVWHGDPGTGKTHALRALAHSWKAWCDTHVVLDPETLLRKADYLHRIASCRPSDQPERFNLIALEDAGELLSADARERIGQGLSRFLNFSDGIAGESLRAMLLVTTNEPLKRLHPAITRPGRAASQVEFEAFDVAAANRWLEEHGSRARTSTPKTVAELYALLEGQTAQVPERRAIGFAA